MAYPNDPAAEFQKNGFLHLKSFASPNDCERLILRMRELTHQKCPNDASKVFDAGPKRQSTDDFFLASAHDISFFFDKNAPIDPKLSPFYRLNKVGHALHDLCPVYQKFSHQRKFYELMGALGLSKPKVVQSMFIFKQPHFGDEVPAHQDASFLYTEPNSAIGLWFALKDASEDNGCLWVLPGGHRGPLKNRFFKHPERGLCFGFEQKVNWPRHLFKPISAQAGDVVVLHGLLPHLSEQNRSHKPRFAYTLHFIDGNSHYRRDNWLKARPDWR